ncbi:thioesterase family protein [Euzebya sp.]|uniref:thioesterase family protein n=1 Tax=Euzebya sp. TaxID=1971409 RepID=UPI0035122EA1
MTADSFFVPEGDSSAGRAYASTVHTTGPWDPRAQHGGPPTALIGHVLDADHPREGFQTVRVTVEILRPVPVARLHVATELLRGGRSVELLGATMTTDDGTPVATARSWRIRTTDLPLHAGVEGDPVTGPDGIEAADEFFTGIGHTGYAQAMEVRFAEGGWNAFGPAVAWMRMRHPLVPDAAPSPLERVLIAADSGNGVSARFRGLFINPDLTVYLTRLPEGEWVCLQAATTLTDHGIGMAASVLHDERGPLGRGLQSLLLDRGGIGQG